MTQTAQQRKRVAAVVTEYRIRSHADNIVTRLLEGYELHWEIVPPRVEVASLYTDQVPANDISRTLAAEHAVPIYPTIREALTLGGDTLAVDGVVIVGEHGTYGYNAKGQHLYPRRRFFEETAAVFRQSGRAVPVFSDKHLAYNWEHAKWIYDTARELGVPFMAGSSMPFAPRLPPLHVPYGADIEEIVVVAQGGVESYGFHALEIAQCLAERRRGHETGVAAVQCLTGPALWEALRTGDRWSRSLESAALAVLEHVPGTPVEHYAERLGAGSEADDGANAGGGADALSMPAPAPASTVTASVGLESMAVFESSPLPAAEPAAFLLEYNDGLRVTVLMLSGYALQWSAAVRLRDEAEPLAATFLQIRRQPLWNFDHQVDLIERLVETGKELVPLERTLLTTGVIDAVMTSRYEGGSRLETPHLAVTYAPPRPPTHHKRSFVIIR